MNIMSAALERIRMQRNVFGDNKRHDLRVIHPKKFIWTTLWLLP